MVIEAAGSPAARILMLIQWRAGLRISEALALRTGDLDLDAQPRALLTVREGKGGKDRVVPVHTELAKELKAYIFYSNRVGDRLFRVSRMTAWRWVRAALRSCVRSGKLAQAKTEKIGTHALRHSAARHWAASGVPLNTVQAWMGHADLSTTAIYLELLGTGAEYMERVK